MTKFSLPKKVYVKLVKQALLEDKVRQDITSKLLISQERQAKAQVIAKQELVLCGMGLAQEVFRQVDPRLEFHKKLKEGRQVKIGQTVAIIEGRARSLLAGERVALNFLQRLSAIATLTRQYVSQLQGTGVRLLDTRKTMPLFRHLERYAVAVGGGVNHRFDLSDAVMVKDNHRALAGPIPEIVKKLQSKLSKKQGIKKIPIIIEVENLREARVALQSGARYLQCDNMSIPQLKQVVVYVRKNYGKQVQLEATGGINLKNIRKVALAGVDFISVGAIIHSAPAVDVSMEILR